MTSKSSALRFGAVQEYMNGVEMKKLNRALILSTKKTVLSEDFIAFAAVDPTLDRLHPLAKAFASTLYQIPGLDENAIQG